MTYDHSGTDVPTPDTLKAQARRLRAAMMEKGTPITHAMALEATARQWGFRDWNTAAARAGTNTPRGWHVGQRVQGRYLGHLFSGKLKAVRAAHGGYWYLTVVFDDPVDVVTSKAFSSYRKQVNVVLNDAGETQAKISDGTPHMTLQAA